MVRSVADRAFLPAKGLFEQVGNMMILTGKTITAAVRPPYPYGGEFVSQFLFALRLCWFPMLISTVAVTYGAPGLQAANFLTLFGALDRLGGFFILASVREFAPLVTAVVVAGVAGTAITADLGARKIREELDALMVLGVDPIKNLVVPRFLSLMIITGLLNVYAIIFGITRRHPRRALLRPAAGRVLRTLFSNASIVDLWGSVLKTLDVRRDRGDRLLLQGDECLRRRPGSRHGGQRGGRRLLHGRLRLQLRVHPDPARDQPRDLDDQVSGAARRRSGHRPARARRS